jgi:hypothetical protein
LFQTCLNHSKTNKNDLSRRCEHDYMEAGHLLMNLVGSPRFVSNMSKAFKNKQKRFISSM